MKMTNFIIFRSKKMPNLMPRLIAMLWIVISTIVIDLFTQDTDVTIVLTIMNMLVTFMILLIIRKKEDKQRYENEKSS